MPAFPASRSRVVPFEPPDEDGDVDVPILSSPTNAAACTGQDEPKRGTATLTTRSASTTHGGGGSLQRRRCKSCVIRLT